MTLSLCLDNKIGRDGTWWTWGPIVEMVIMGGKRTCRPSIYIKCTGAKKTYSHKLSIYDLRSVYSHFSEQMEMNIFKVVLFHLPPTNNTSYQIDVWGVCICLRHLCPVVASLWSFFSFFSYMCPECPLAVLKVCRVCAEMFPCRVFSLHPLLS